MSTYAPDALAARRRVELWPLRRGALHAAAVAIAGGVVMAAGAGVWPIAAVLATLFVLVLVRRVYAHPARDIADLRAAAPALTPDERARALTHLGGPWIDPDRPVEDPGLEALRRDLHALPGGVRRRSALALRDPDERVPLVRSFVVRALVAFPVASVLVFQIADGTAAVPDAVVSVLGPVTLLAPPALTFADRRMRPAALRRRAGWALGSLAMTLVWTLASGFVPT